MYQYGQVTTTPVYGQVPLATSTAYAPTVASSGVAVGPMTVSTPMTSTIAYQGPTTTYQTTNVVSSTGFLPVQNNAISSLQYNGMNNFTLITCGNGISPQESEAIKRAAFEGLQTGANPLSNYVAKRIKELLSGDWLAVCYDVNNPKDFSLTTVRSSDFMVFVIGNIKFEICRTRERSDITQSYAPQVYY